MPPNHLRFIDMLKLSLRTFRVKPIRAILTIFGMSIGIAAVLFLISLGYGLQYILLGKLVTTEDSLITMEVSYPQESNLSITTDKLEQLRGLPNVAEVSPVGEYSGEAQAASSSGLLVNIRIIEPSYYRLSGTRPDIGTDLTSRPGVILTSQTLGPLNLPAGNAALQKMLGLTVFYDSGSDQADQATSTSELPLMGIIADNTQPPMVEVLDSSLTKSPPFYQKVLVKATSVDTLEPLRDKLIADGFLVSARVDLVNQARKIMNVITIVLGVFGVTALVVSAIGMFNTMIVGFLERIYEVGILKSLGATDTDVRNLFLMESMIMGLFGGTGGIVLGVGASKFCNFLINIFAHKLGSKSLELFITPPWFIVFVLVLSGGIGLASGFWPAHRASGLSPKEAFMRK